MQIDFTKILKQISGEPLIHEDRPATLRDIALKALLEYPAKHGEKAKLFLLARKIAEADAVELKAEEIALLKQRIDGAPFFVPQGAGQAILMLDRAEIE
jgi:hypothetical protein